MRKVLKLSGIILGGLLVLLIATAIIVPLVVDVNDYKPRIEAAVADATGRELTIAGDIELSLFPWIGVEIGETRVGNAANFDDQAFAEIKAAQVRIKLLPLLGREVVVDEIVVENPVIRLQRNANGVGNWEDLAKQPAQESPQKQEPAAEIAEASASKGSESPEKGGLEKLEIDGLRLTGAAIYFDDRASGMSAKVENLDFLLGKVSLPVDTQLKVSGEFSVSEPGIAGNFTLSSDVLADTETQVYRLQDGRFSIVLNGDAIPVQDLEVRLDWQDIVANLAADTADVQAVSLNLLGTKTQLAASVNRLMEAPRLTASLEFQADDLEETGAALGELIPASVKLAGSASAGLELHYDQAAGKASLDNVLVNAMGLTAELSANASGLPDEPRIKGNFVLEEFPPVRLMSRLGMQLPPTSDDTVLEKASVNADFGASPTSAQLENLDLVLDDSRITGQAGITDFEKQALRFELAMDAIDVDRYLPPSAQDAQQDEEAAGDINAMEIPVEPLRGLDIVGHMTIGKMKAVGFRSHDIEVGINAKNDKLRIHPAKAQFYEGGYRGDIRIDASGDVARFSIDEHLETVQLGPLLKDVMDVSYISGSAKMDIAATAQGRTVGDIRKSLDGSLAANIKDGTLEGFNLWESIRKAYATIQGKSYTPKDSENRTEFTELSATGKIRNGVFQNDKLDMRLPFLRVNGKGDIDLVKETLDYRVDAKIVASAELEGGLDDLKGITIPVRLTGPLTAPKVRPELGEALKAKAKAELEKKKAQAEAEARQKLEEQKKKAEEEAKEKVEDKLKDKLKGLFD